VDDADRSPFDGCDITDPDAILASSPVATGIVPRKNNKADWELARRLYEDGVMDGGDRFHPSIRDISKCARARSAAGVDYHKHRGNWKHMDRGGNPMSIDEYNRLRESAGLTRIKTSVDIENERLARAKSAAVPELEPVNPGALSTPAAPLASSSPSSIASPLLPVDLGSRVDRALAAAERVIERFEELARTGALESVSVKDFDTVVRLRAFLRGEADKRITVRHVVSLEELQTKHLGARRAAHALTDGVAGVIAAGSSSAGAPDEDGPTIVEGEFEDAPGAGDGRAA
jgi:hypothetical protein